MTEICRYVLAGPFHSGRGVQLRMLGPAAVDQCYRDAAEELRAKHGVGGEPTAIEFQQLAGKIGVARCLVAITRDVVPRKPPPPKPTEPQTPSAKRRAPTRGAALGSEEPEPDQEWLGKNENWIFAKPGAEEDFLEAQVTNAKDDHWLTIWWRRAHEIQGDAVDRIVSKGQRVSSG